MNKLRLFLPLVYKRVWGQEIIYTESGKYLGKILKYNAGKMGGLQYHINKDETFILFEGEGWMDYDTGDGELGSFRLTPGIAVHIPPLTPHRFRAETDCIGLESSTAHYQDRVRCEEKYGIEIAEDYGLVTTKGDVLFNEDRIDRENDLKNLHDRDTGC